MMSRHLSELDIYRSANLWLELHRDAAVAQARRMAAQFRDKRDAEGADAWLRIVVALESLRSGLDRAAS